MNGIKNNRNYGIRPQEDSNRNAKSSLEVIAMAANKLIKVLSGDVSVNWKTAQEEYVSVFLQGMGKIDGVISENISMGNIPGILVAPKNLSTDRTVFYIHGGGYVSGSASMYVYLASQLATALQAKVYIPDYRLAPEFPYPTPINDTLDAYRWLVDEGRANPTNLCIIGDSAGGAMVVTIMAKARNEQLPLPAAAVALSPWANLEHSGASMSNRNSTDPMVTKEILDRMADTFLQGALRADPDVSPVFADVRNLPPTMIAIGENEVMLDDAVRLAHHLGTQRVRVNLEIWPGLFHVWPQYGPKLDESRQVIENITYFVGKHLQ